MLNSRRHCDKCNSVSHCNHNLFVCTTYVPYISMSRYGCVIRTVRTSLRITQYSIENNTVYQTQTLQSVLQRSQNTAVESLRITKGMQSRFPYCYTVVTTYKGNIGGTQYSVRCTGTRMDRSTVLVPVQTNLESSKINMAQTGYRTMIVISTPVLDHKQWKEKIRMKRSEEN